MLVVPDYCEDSRERGPLKGFSQVEEYYLYLNPMTPSRFEQNVLEKATDS